MGLIGKLRKLLPSNSVPVEQENEEFEHAEKQPETRKRRMDKQSMVIYDQEQGSSSNFRLLCRSADWLFSNHVLCEKETALKDKLNRLLHRQCDVLAELKNSENQPGNKRREEVRLWLSEVERIIDEIDQGSLSKSNLPSFVKKVDDLIQRCQFPNGLVLFAHESTRLPLSQGMKPVGINFQQNAEKVQSWFQNHKHCIMGVYGMGGVGKTTLLTHIHDQFLQDPNLSGRVYWVTVSQYWSVHKLQEDIAKVIGLASLEERDERKRAAILHNKLAAMGQIVLILDDMWKRVSASKVGIPLESSNCKIILSTRSYDVCREMKCNGFVIKVETLNEGEAWDFFVKNLGHYDTLEEEAKRIAKDVAKECGGLPLAIATMARSMTEVVDINEWKTALYDLKSACGQVDMEEEVIQILRYSYDRLKERLLQDCFLSCILYGEDEKIQRTTLIDLWINEGLLDVGSRDDQVAKGQSVLNKLESCCLLESTLDSDYEKCVKMHDLIRDMAIIITKKHPFFIVETGQQLEQVPNKERWSKDLVKVSLIHNEIEEIPCSMDIKTPILNVLMLNDNPLSEIPDSFFVHMRALTVLDLSRTDIKSVPESVSYLQNLRALLLVDCKELEHVPSVANLTKLRMLDLEGCCTLKEAPKGLEKLTNIEKVSYIPWNVSDLSRFNKMIQSLSSFTSLGCYRIWMFDNSFEQLEPEWNEFFEFENVVYITRVEFGREKSSCLLPTTLERLEIYESGINGRSLGDVFPSLGDSTTLKHIDIRKCAGLEYIIGSSLVCTTQLENLELGILPDFRGIGKLSAPDSFSHLQVLVIFECPKMKVVFPITCTGQPLHLPYLEFIQIEECEEVEEIFESNPNLALPKLEHLELRRLPSMKVIFSHTEQIELELSPDFRSIGKITLSRLWVLKISECPKMKVVFPITCTGQPIHLLNLESIEIEECEEVEEIFGSNKTCLSYPIHFLPNLNELCLRGLPKLKVIFPFAEELQLPNLKSIMLTECVELEKIFDSNPNLALPKLEHLLLCELPKMKVIFPLTEQIHLPNLRKIVVEQCEEVEKIFDSIPQSCPS